MKAAITIRRADASDLHEMAAIYIEGWNDSVDGLLSQEIVEMRTFDYRLNYLTERLAQSHEWYPIVGECSGRVAVIACPSLVSPETGEIEHIYVRRQYRRNGFATAMVAHILQRFLEHGVSQAVLWSFEGNTNAIEYYRATGWVPTGHRKHVPIDQTDAELPVIEFSRPVLRRR